MTDLIDRTDESYEAAVASLYSPLHQSVTKEAIQAAAARRVSTVQDMRAYMRRIAGRGEGGWEQPFKTISVIHVTGTKGKGSTACMCEAILRRAHGKMTGLFTSPHLTDIRERIRVGGNPVSRTVFASAYWNVRRKLERHRAEDDDDDGLPVLPGYFRMLTLMALYIFSNYSPSIEVIILEVGMGGRYDATNIIDHSTTAASVCGVTLLDYDHTRILGNTLEEIAWEKGGIFAADKLSTEDTSPRPNPSSKNDAETDTATNNTEMQIPKPVEKERTLCRLFALDCNTKSVLTVLEQCATLEGRGQPLCLVGSSKTNPDSHLPSECRVGLAGAHQRFNAQLSLALCRAIMRLRPTTEPASRLLPASAEYDALAQASWPGRCQKVRLGPDRATDGDATEADRETKEGVALFLDGSHTELSIQAGIDWFHAETVNRGDSVKRALLFACSHERNPADLLSLLLPEKFDFVFFCRPDSQRPSAVAQPTAAELLQRRAAAATASHADGQKYADLPTTCTWQETLAVVWEELQKEQSPGSAAKVVANLSASGALDELRKKHETESFEATQVFVTGSLYLVGSALSAIQWEEPDASGSLIFSTEEAPVDNY